MAKVTEKVINITTYTVELSALEAGLLKNVLGSIGGGLTELDRLYVALENAGVNSIVCGASNIWNQDVYRPNNSYPQYSESIGNEAKSRRINAV